MVGLKISERENPTHAFRDQCDIINAKTIHGYSNFIYNEGQFDAEEAKNRDRWLSESYKFCISEEVMCLLGSI